MLGHRQRRHRAGLGGGQHQPAADLLAVVVGRRGAVADVHELGADLARDAVLGQGHRPAAPVGHQPRVAPAVGGLHLLPQLAALGVPGRPRALGAVEDLAVGRQLEDLDRRQAGVAGSGRNRLGRGPEAARAAHPVVQRQLFDGVAGCRAGQLSRQGHHLLRRQQRRRRGGGGGAEAERQQRGGPPPAVLSPSGDHGDSRPQLIPADHGRTAARAATRHCGECRRAATPPAAGSAGAP